MEIFAIVLEDIQKWITTEAVQIILIGIDNDIYSIVDACPNAMEMWKAIKRLKQGELINVQDLEPNISQAATRNRGKEIANSPPHTYDPEPKVVANDDASSKEKKIDKLMALISMSFKNIYKPTNNKLRTSSNTKNLNADNTLRSSKGTGYDRQTRQYDNQRTVNVVGVRECQKLKRAGVSAYHKEKMLLCKREEVRIQLSAEQVDWRDETYDEPEDQELEAHYMYMAKIQEVTPDVVDNSRPIFDAEPFQSSTVKFGNDQFAPILGYGDLVQGNFTIKRKSTCYVRDLKENDLLTGSRGIDLYSITLQDTTSPNPICLMAKASSSQAWLWHRCLSHLNFDTINLLSKNDIVIGLPKLKFVKDHLCSSYELGKAKRQSVHTKTTSRSKRRLQLLHMDLCDPMRVESINGNKYVLVIVDDYSKYTWTYFLRSKPKFSLISSDLSKEDFVLKWNHTLVEAARTMLSAAQVPLFFWAEAISTTCFTQERHSGWWGVFSTCEIPYHIINGRKSSVKFFYIFGSLCYIVRDGENLDKMKEKGDACIFVGYSTQSRAYRVYNKRTRVRVETIHVNFNELPLMASDYVSFDPLPQCPTTALEHDSLSPKTQSHKNVPQAAEIVTTSNELDLLFSPMFDELLNGTTPVVSKSSAVNAAEALDKRQQQNIT
ncbi:retrovirus-related pol polyprotein from transposon TNT 1-94 [Tanacetum coccineum]